MYFDFFSLLAGSETGPGTKTRSSAQAAKSEKNGKVKEIGMAPPDRAWAGLACRWGAGRAAKRAGTKTRSSAQAARSEKNWKSEKKLEWLLQTGPGPPWHAAGGLAGRPGMPLGGWPGGQTGRTRPLWCCPGAAGAKSSHF